MPNIDDQGLNRVHSRLLEHPTDIRLEAAEPIKHGIKVHVDRTGIQQLIVEIGSSLRLSFPGIRLF